MTSLPLIASCTLLQCSKITYSHMLPIVSLFHDIRHTIHTVIIVFCLTIMLVSESCCSSLSSIGLSPTANEWIDRIPTNKSIHLHDSANGFPTNPTQINRKISFASFHQLPKPAQPKKYSVNPLISLESVYPHADNIRLVLRLEEDSIELLPREIVLSLTDQQLQSSSSPHYQPRKQLNFVSSHFVFAHHQLVEDSDYHQTVELRPSSRLQYYSNNLIDNLTTLPHDPIDVSQKGCHKGSNEHVCQLFAGRVLHNVTPYQEDKYADQDNYRHGSSTFSICLDGSLSGIITWIPYGQFIIEPINRANCKFESVPLSSSTQYFGWNFHNESKLFKTCKHSLQFIPWRNDWPRRLNRSKSHQFKRSVSLERNIEVLVVTDTTMQKYHGDSVHNYVLTLMGIVSHIFQHSTIGNEINIKLVKLTSLVDEKQEKGLFESSQNTLQSFCRWQFAHNYPSDDHPLHHDTAILLTRRDLCRNGIGNDTAKVDMTKSRPIKSCDTLGLAHSGQICDPESSCAIVEDNGLSAAFTIAHELGHVLGIPHDDEEKCKKYYASAEGQMEMSESDHKRSNVMARMIDYTSHMWSWSACSKHYITEYLDSGHGNCLLDDNSVDLQNSSGTLFTNLRRSSQEKRFWINHLPKFNSALFGTFSPAGMLYDADEQCRLVFGKSSKICLDMPFCRRLWCSVPSDTRGCHTQHMPWADGTICGLDKWCQQGECVPIDMRQMKPVDGGWGNWSKFSECSLPCGSGIRRSKRRCNNPKPQNGGKFCLGERIRYQSCNTHLCDSSVPNVREQQCSKYNGQNFKISGVSANVTWVPQYTGIPQSDACKLYCTDSETGEYFMLNHRVLDGTPCFPDSYDLCVDGKCLSAGCDHILGSGVKTDWCGVCGGDNSTCREISGNYKPGSVTHGYNFVVTIPPGATNIEVVKERSSFGGDNWLAMRQDDQSYLLNGRFTVNVYERKWHYGGTTIEYSGVSQHGYERINTSRPINSALHIEVLCVGELHVPSVSYRYAMSLNTTTVKYKWAMNRKWSECSQVCNGEQQRKPVCIHVSSKSKRDSRGNARHLVVQDEFCSSQVRPPIQSRVCNSHCELEWHVKFTGPCSASCGKGVRKRTVYCSQRLLKRGNKLHYINDAYCAHLGPKPDTLEPCNGTDCRITYQWRYLDWSSCSVVNTCGNGNQSRVAQCVSIMYLNQTDIDAGDNKEMVVESITNEQECLSHLPEPTVIQSCNVECPQWSTSLWSKCSGTCGRGEQSRIVICKHGTQQVDEAYCNLLEAKPSDHQSCDLPECPQLLSIHSRYSYDLPANFSERDQYQLESNANTNYLKLDSKALSPVSTEYSNLQTISEQIVNKKQTPIGVWMSGEWSSCNDTYKKLQLFEQQLLQHFNPPDCFNSNKELTLFQQKFMPLFKLNESVVSKSYSALDSVFDLEELSFVRRRYVACVIPNTQQMLTDSECDFKLKPKVEDFCPFSDKLLNIPVFYVHYCNTTDQIINKPTSPTISFPTHFESVKNDNNSINHDSSHSNALTVEKIDWRLGPWSNCVCDSEQGVFIHKRLVLCVRQFYLTTYDEATQNQQTVADEYCLENKSPKPPETEQCSNGDKPQCLTSQAFTTLPNNMLEQTPDLSSTMRVEALSSSEVTSQGPTSVLNETPELPITKTTSFDDNTVPILTTPLPLPLESRFEDVFSTPMSSFYETSQFLISLHPNEPNFDVYNDDANSFLHHSQSPLIYSSMNYEVSNNLPNYGTIDHNPSSMTPSPLKSNLNSLDSSILNTNHVYGHWTQWSEWSECCCSCQNATQRSDPICPTGQRCNPLLKPKSKIRPCNLSCDLFQWHYSEWSSCSVNCGQGVRTRSAECHDWTGVMVPNRFCENHKLVTTEKCHKNDCKLVWRTGPWSECSQSCGTGIQTRPITCHRINTYGFIDPEPMSYPNSIAKYKRKRHMKQHGMEPNYYYNYKRTQTHDLRHMLPQWCNEKHKPIEQKFCNFGSCPNSNFSDVYVWRPLQWQPCSSACGDGYQIRKVHCYSYLTGFRVSRFHCNLKIKPERRRACNLRPCQVISCHDLRERGQLFQDGEYELWLQGASIRVYCFGMNSLAKPIEYLILSPTVYDDNYSQLIRKSRDCSNDFNTTFPMDHSSLKHHMTFLYFKYIRFNVTSLEIITSDTLFAMLKDASQSMSRSSNKLLMNKLSIGFGQAFVQGCPVNDEPKSTFSSSFYSIKCSFSDNEFLSKAMFSINLHKTGLIVASDTNWRKIGSRINSKSVEKHIKRSRNGEKIVGYCGFGVSKYKTPIGYSSHSCRVGCLPVGDVIKLQVP